MDGVGWCECNGWMLGWFGWYEGDDWYEVDGWLFIGIGLKEEDDGWLFDGFGWNETGGW